MAELETYILNILGEDNQYHEIPAIKGDKGDPGDTPVKGVDYFTPAEQEAFLEESKAYSDSKLVTIDIQQISENSFWTVPIGQSKNRPTSTDIINMVNANKEVRLHFFDTITNTGDQLYSYETTQNGVPYFRRNVLTADKAERINIGVMWNGEVKFVTDPVSAKAITATVPQGLTAEPNVQSVVDALASGGEKPYELIKTILTKEPTVLIDNKESDGTPYKFSRVKVLISTDGTEENKLLGMNLGISLNKGADVIATYGARNASARYVWLEYFRNHGEWTFNGSGASLRDSVADNGSPTIIPQIAKAFNNIEGDYIREIKSSYKPFPANCKIEIWAVRA